jgi:histidinol-phosphate/aromatic aminotransferase/cobyric acid decarboxylase-like protein
LVTLFWINPANPTGSLTAYDNADITKFAALLAKFS